MNLFCLMMMMMIVTLCECLCAAAAAAAATSTAGAGAGGLTVQSELSCAPSGKLCERYCSLPVDRPPGDTTPPWEYTDSLICIYLTQRRLKNI